MKFIIHLVGDLHQPLHCVQRDGDKGGNTRLVFFLDRRKADSLHYVWDTALVREMVGRRAIAPVAEAMSKSIAATQRKEWATGTPESWANEAHRVAVEEVYAVVADGGDPPKLGPDYMTRATPVVTRQIKRAGLRLAVVLNQTLVTSAVPTSRPVPDTATSRPATQPDGSLMRELARAVEIAQQKIRAKPQPAPPPPKNSLQQSRVAAPPDPLKPIADELVGKSGSIAVTGGGCVRQQQADGVRRAASRRPEARRRSVSRPRGMREPHRIYLSDAQQREVQRARDRGDADAGARVRARAEAGKPAHRFWILTDDKAVQEWSRGSRHYLHAEVVTASPGRTPWYDYVKADVVVRMKLTPAATTQRSGSD